MAFPRGTRRSKKAFSIDLENRTPQNQPQNNSQILENPRHEIMGWLKPNFDFSLDLRWDWFSSCIVFCRWEKWQERCFQFFFLHRFPKSKNGHQNRYNQLKNFDQIEQVWTDVTQNLFPWFLVIVNTAWMKEFTFCSRLLFKTLKYLFKSTQNISKKNLKPIG